LPFSGLHLCAQLMGPHVRTVNCILCPSTTISLQKNHGNMHFSWFLGD
jgi:hypothetical protein